jgi:hypothetical protein
MTPIKMSKWILSTTLIVTLSACGGGGGGLFGLGDKDSKRIVNEGEYVRDFDSTARQNAENKRAAGQGGGIFDLFRGQQDPNVTLKVNKYLWSASLDVLNFMPIEAADPFTGTISMGYGRPQGGGAAYRATVYITDPALDARSLRVALQGSGGRAVSTETVRAVEDAILTRARQLRIADGKL